ncbi:MAG TPA: murein biosynthesis integral membrane protein MurJ [Candidatus Saccharimonadales bacterium]|nr:murein biosynthesis integral membrane protein MurJ [Candidatus Saccharimonadales bacterium]
MLKSSGGIGAATLSSRLLGLVREQVYAAFMGTGVVYAAFIYAYMVPNLFRRLLGEGALTAAFIPIFKAKEKNEGEASMWSGANAVLSGLLVAAGGLTVLAIVIISILLMFGSWSDNTRLMLQLMRLMFPYMLLACVGAVFIGICNSRGHFFIPALGAAVLNVVMIASVIFLVPHMGKTLETQIFALAIGVLVAGVAQAAFQLPVLRAEGFRYRWVAPWSNPMVREVVVKMLPSVIGVAAFQINLLLTQTLAYGENARIVGQFAYAVRLMELPQGVFGLSLATFLLPTLAGLAVDKNFPQFRATLRQAVEHLVFVNLLASILLFTLAAPIIRLLFQHGKFGEYSTDRVSLALVCLVPGLISFSLVNILARAFYALGEIKVPMRISIFCLGINFIFTLAFLFGLQLGAGSLGLANSLSSVCNLGLLLFALRKKPGRLRWPRPSLNCREWRWPG